jgi:hypothetical protein
MTAEELQEKIQILEANKQFSSMILGFLPLNIVDKELRDSCIEKQNNLDKQIAEAKNKLRLLKLQSLE